jgi:hypothetical protein
MQVLVDVDGWQRVINIKDPQDVIQVLIPSPFLKMFRAEARIDDDTPFITCHRTPFIINGMPLYAWRY